MMTWIRTTITATAAGIVMLSTSAGLQAGTADRAGAGRGEQKPSASVAQVQKEALTRIDKGKMPWQFYNKYAAVFEGYAEALPKAENKGGGQAERIRKWRQYYRQFADLIRRMGKQRKVIAGILQHNTDVAEEKRDEKLKLARKKHEKLRQRAANKAGNPPKNPPPNFRRQGSIVPPKKKDGR